MGVPLHDLKSRAQWLLISHTRYSVQSHLCKPPLPLPLSQWKGRESRIFKVLTSRPIDGDSDDHFRERTAGCT